MLFGSDEYRQSRIIEVEAWINKRFGIIDDIPDNYFQGICYFSLLERFAQEYSNYPQKDCNEVFCSFVLLFQRNYDFLKELDPVTLYYDFQTELENHFDLSFLETKSNYNPIHAVQSGRAEEMYQYLKHLGKKDKRIDRHRYVKLLYSLRSKLSHELSSPTAMFSTEYELLKFFPYYSPLSRSYIKNDAIIRDEVWELKIPVGFIKALARECIISYMHYCQEQKRDPFENSGIIRKSETAWFDD